MGVGKEGTGRRPPLSREWGGSSPPPHAGHPRPVAFVIKLTWSWFNLMPIIYIEYFGIWI